LLRLSVFDVETEIDPSQAVAAWRQLVPGDRQRCLEAGMNDYVSKPVSPGALVEALNAWLTPDTPATPPDVSAGEILESESSVSESAPEVPIFDRAALVADFLAPHGFHVAIEGRGDRPHCAQSSRRGTAGRQSTRHGRFFDLQGGAAELSRCHYHVDGAG
jgi:hypothetical protein